MRTVGKGCSVAFGVQDSDGGWLTDIDWEDKTAVWAAPQIPDASLDTYYELSLFNNYGLMFQSYKIYAGIKDSNDVITYLEFPIKKVCKPNGFTDKGYVDGIFSLISDCNNQTLTVSEDTVMTYLDNEPISKVCSGTLYYPRGTVADLAFTKTPFTNNVLYTGTYTIASTTTASFDEDDDFYVQVKYVTENIDYAVIS